MEDSTKYCKVCVTGGAGYIASSLIKKLLDKGTYMVHATLRNLGDSAKVGLLKSLPGAETRLQLFEADLYNPEQFEAAIRDCLFVLHVATPLLHTQNSKYKDTTEAAIAGVKNIVTSCLRSGTVRRFIYTASVVAASPLKNDGSGYKDCMDEACWTPLNIPFAFAQENEKNYIISKTQSEREMLNFGDGQNLEVVTLAFGLVGGETILSYIPASVSVVVSQLTDNEVTYKQLRFLEELCGKIPIIHIEDTCEAHIFCMENASVSGRFLCASHYVSSSEIANYYKQSYPDFPVKQMDMDVPNRPIKWTSTKLIDKGFKYKYEMKMILDDSLQCARKFNAL